MAQPSMEMVEVFLAAAQHGDVAQLRAMIQTGMAVDAIGPQELDRMPDLRLHPAADQAKSLRSPRHLNLAPA